MSENRKLGTFKCKAMPVLAGEEVFGEVNGKEQVGLGIRIIGDGPFKDQTLPWYGFFNSDDNAKRTIRQLSLLGAKMKNGDVTDLTGLGNKEAFADVEESEFEGEKRVRVSWITNGGAVMSNTLTPSKKSALSARLRGLATATGNEADHSAPTGGNDFPV